MKKIDFDFFIKDYVKSVKTDKGVEKINHKTITCVDFMNKINDFVEERGNLFTGGIVLKEFVNLKKINEKMKTDVNFKRTVEGFKKRFEFQ